MTFKDTKQNKQVTTRLGGFALYFLIYELTIYLSNDMVMPAMLTVVADFHGHPSDVALSLSLYVLGGSLLQIFLGPLSERIGKRIVMLAGNVMFIASTFCIAHVHTMDEFLIARFVQGMGSCFIFIGYALVHELYDDVRAVKLTTLLSNTAIFAPLIGPAVGSLIITQFPWQTIFSLSLSLSLISLVGLAGTMPTHSLGHGVSRPSYVQALKSYHKILASRHFMFGILVAGLAITPLTAWIGLSPVILMGTLKLSYGYYVGAQVLVFSGFILSTFIIQGIDGGTSLTTLIRRGAWYLLAGAILSAATVDKPLAFTFGMFLYSAGFGYFNGALVRLSLNATGVSMALSSCMMSFLYCLYIALGLEVFNLVGHRLNYSLASYAWCNLVFASLVFLGLIGIAHSYKKPQRSGSSLTLEHDSANELAS